MNRTDYTAYASLRYCCTCEYRTGAALCCKCYLTKDKPNYKYTPQEGDKVAQPYLDNECTHYNRCEIKGQTKCKDCGSVYNEKTLTWENPDADIEEWY